MICCLSFAIFMSLVIGVLVNNFLEARASRQGPLNMACVISAVAPTILFMAVYEARYFLNQWENNIKQSEELARVHLISQFETLKKQLDPHFLFNSLNAISSLVETNPLMAEEFIRKLAKLYQYTLESYEKPWVSLEEELSFVQAYQYLLHTRFKDALSVRIDVPEEMLQKSVPPLTLQMLVENAVKHNQMSAEQPLQVDISMLDQWISVSNNITEAPVNASSFQIGLSNIRERYRILADKEVEVVSGDSFTVKLPIL